MSKETRKLPMFESIEEYPGETMIQKYVSFWDAVHSDINPLRIVSTEEILEAVAARYKAEEEEDE